MQIQIDPALFTAFFLALVRASAWIFFAPPFNNKSIPTQVKAGLAGALALAAAPTLAHTVPVDDAGFIGAIVTQAVIGVALALITQLLIAAIAAAGSLIDLFAGYSISSLYDPMADANAAVFGRFYQLVAITLLFAINGHLVLVRGFMTSFEAIGANGFSLNGLGELLTKDLGLFFVSAIEIAAPVLAVLFLTEIAMGLLSRAAPSMNVFELAFPIRVVVALLLVSVSLPLLIPGIRALVEQIAKGLPS
jgi:flagellar biosynthetic protein FliR